MIPLRPDRSAACLPPLQLGRSTGPAVALRLHWSFLTRGLLVLAALALPALGIRLADLSVQPSESGAMQVAAVLPTPPVRMAATTLPARSPLMLPVSALTSLHMGIPDKPTLTIDLLLCAVLAVGVVSLMILAAV